jgi:hypothetical protein
VYIHVHVGYAGLAVVTLVLYFRRKKSGQMKTIVWQDSDVVGEFC